MVINLKALLGKVRGLIITATVTVAMLSGCVVNITGPMSWDLSSDPRALSEVLTGVQVADCIPLGAKIGDVVKLDNGDTAEVKSISANQTRCTNPERPVRANIERKSVATAAQSKPETTLTPVTTTAITLSPALIIAPASVEPLNSLSQSVPVPAGGELKHGKTCEGLGFQRVSAGFTTCVNELLNRDSAKQLPVQMKAHDLTCKNLGFVDGSQAFRVCVDELNARSR